MSAAAQLQQAKAEGCVDLETPDSVLTQVNLRSLLNKQTFSMLPRLYQHKLVQLLPHVDRENLSDTQSDFRCVTWVKYILVNKLEITAYIKNKIINLFIL